ncbi:hypothetical protein MRX96_032201 [Rhipicephalus microplus]
MVYTIRTVRARRTPLNEAQRAAAAYPCTLDGRLRQRRAKHDAERKLRVTEAARCGGSSRDAALASRFHFLCFRDPLALQAARTTGTGRYGNRSCGRKRRIDFQPRVLCPRLAKNDHV